LRGCRRRWRGGFGVELIHGSRHAHGKFLANDIAPNR